MLLQYWICWIKASRDSRDVDHVHTAVYSQCICLTLIPHIKDIKHTISKVQYVIIRHIIPGKENDGDDLSHIALSVAYRSILLDLNDFLSRLGKKKEQMVQKNYLNTEQLTKWIHLYITFRITVLNATHDETWWIMVSVLVTVLLKPFLGHV